MHNIYKIKIKNIILAIRTLYIRGIVTYTIIFGLKVLCQSRTFLIKHFSMDATKEELIRFLEERVLIPTENNPDADKTIKRKINLTRVRLNNQVNAEMVRQYFWSAMATDAGIDSYNKISSIGAPTFEDVRAEFKKLCGDR